MFTVDDVKIATKKYIDACDNKYFDVLTEWSKTGAAVSLPTGWFKDHFAQAESRSFLSKLDIPVGCFHGELDRMTSIGGVEQLEAKAKASKLEKKGVPLF